MNDGEDSYIEDTRTGEKRFFEPYDSLWPEVHPRPEIEEIRATIGDSVEMLMVFCVMLVDALRLHLNLLIKWCPRSLIHSFPVRPGCEIRTIWFQPA